MIPAEFDRLIRAVLWKRDGTPDSRTTWNEIDYPAIASALHAAWEREHIGYNRANGALADAATVPTDDIERGIRLLTAERDALRLERDAGICENRVLGSSRDAIWKERDALRERVKELEEDYKDTRVELQRVLGELMDEDDKTASLTARVRALTEAARQMIALHEEGDHEFCLAEHCLYQPLRAALTPKEPER